MTTYSQSTTQQRSTGASTAGSSGPDATESVKAEAARTKDEAKRAIRDIGDDARERARSGVEDGKHALAEHLRAMCAMSDAAADESEAVEKAPPPKYIRSVGKNLERAADYIDNTSIDELKNDVADFAHRHPAIMLGGLAVLGFAAGRLLTAKPVNQSSSDSYDSASTSGYAGSRSEMGSASGVRSSEYGSPSSPQRVGQSSSGYASGSTGTTSTGSTSTGASSISGTGSSVTGSSKKEGGRDGYSA